MDNTIGAATLIKKFFNPPNAEIIALPSADRVQLGSAIAREQGLKQEQLNFQLVEY